MLQVYINGNLQNVPTYLVAIVVSVVVAIFVAFYILRSIGVYTMAKNSGISYAYVSWIPFAWYYVLGKLCGEAKFFGSKIKKFALILTLVCGIAELIALVYSILYYLPLIGYYLSGGKVTHIISFVEGTTQLPGTGYFGNPYSQIRVASDFIYVYTGTAQMPIGVAKFLNVLYYVSDFVDIANIIFLIVAYVEIFKKYFPSKYFLATIFSLLGLFAPFIFAVRKNPPTDYNAYIRARYEAMYKNRYGGAGGVNMGGPYNNTENPFNQQNNNQSKNSDSKEPFEDFNSEKPKDPFEEFNDKDKN